MAKFRECVPTAGSATCGRTWCMVVRDGPFGLESRAFGVVICVLRLLLYFVVQGFLWVLGKGLLVKLVFPIGTLYNLILSSMIYGIHSSILLVSYTKWFKRRGGSTGNN